jgi:serine/threonine protein kinase/Tol biopolymer transport system component
MSLASRTRLALRQAQGDLEQGRKVGPYEILGLIGAGGMGEVYKARDTRLDRTVALKILPAELSTDPERRARFEREARAIASLSHPHICAIYDVGEALVPNPESVAAGQRGHRIPNPESPIPDEIAIHYLVMEHLSGQTLAERLARGALPLGEALEIATEIADALDAAHRQGIIHRDLKPGNVMLATGGTGRSGQATAKLLDFGLAKALAPAGASAAADATAAATITDSLTVRGSVMGTLPYMAPELLEGRRADARSDLWALGAMIYEMLTGSRAFAGDSQASLIGSIMNAEPPALAERQPLTPPALEHVVRKCLAKRPDERWDSAHDVADELRWIAEAAGVSQPGTSSRPRRSRWIVHAVWATACLSLLAFLAREYFWRPREDLGGRAAARPVVHMDVVVPENLPLWLDPEVYPPSFAIAPDGSSMAYTCARGASTQLCLRRFDRSEVTPIAGSENARYPVYSSDGRSLVFCVARDTTCEGGGAIRALSIADGRIETVGTIPKELLYVLHLGWFDENDLLLTGFGGLWTLAVSDGAATPLLRSDAAKDEVAYSYPSVLPGGRRLIVTVAGDELREVRAVSLDTGEQRILMQNAPRSWYLPTGHLVYYDWRSGSHLMASLDPETLALGPPVELSEPVRVIGGHSGLAFSANGTLLYLPALADRVLAWVDRQRRESPAIPDKGSWGFVRMHPDGRRAAVDVVSDRGLPGIAVVDIDRGVTTPAASSATNPVWTHDGSRIAFLEAPRLSAMLWGPADGSAPPEVIHTRYVENIGSVTRKGDFAVTTRSRSPLRFEIGILSRSDSGWALRRYLPVPGDDSARSHATPRFSPDDKWIAYNSNESGRWDVWVRAYPGAGERTRVSSGGGYGPIWSRDGRELFYRNGDRFYGVRISSFSPLTMGTPQLIFQGPYLDSGPLAPPDYDVAPDGQRFLVVRVSDEERAPRRFHLVQNWFDEVRAKVPATPGSGKPGTEERHDR